MKPLIYISHDPVVVPHGNTPYYELYEDWYFFLNGKIYWIPKGYYGDGASIPWIFTLLIAQPFDPRFAAMWIFHDWIYLTHLFSRSIADEGAYQIIKNWKKEPEWKCKAVWAGVRTGGAFAWNNSIADIEELARLKSELNLRPDGGKFLLEAV